MNGVRGTRLAALVLLASVLLTSAQPAVADDRDTIEGDGLVQAVRWSGENRIDTAARIATEFSALDGSGESSAVVARADLFADALAGSYLAGALGAPVLLTRSDRLDAVTEAKLGPGDGNLDASDVYLVGGTAALGPEVEQALIDAGHRVHRVGGADRNETAARIATGAPGATVGVLDGERTAILARNDQFPDALVAGALAYGHALPLLLTGRTALPDATRTALGSLGIQHVLIAGGPDAVGEEVASVLSDEGITTTRLAGPTRTGTAVAFARFATAELGFRTAAMSLARGDDFPDALALSAFAGRERGPVLLTVSTAELGEDAAGHLRDSASCEPQTLYVAGGPVAIGAPVVDGARRAFTPASGVCEDAPPPPESPRIVSAAGETRGDDADLVTVAYDRAVFCGGAAPAQFTYQSGDGPQVPAGRLVCPAPTTPTAGGRALLDFPDGTLTPGTEGVVTYRESAAPEHRLHDDDGVAARSPDDATLSVAAAPAPPGPDPSPSPTPSEAPPGRATWELLPSRVPVERDYAVMAHHSASGEVVLFGGNNSSPEYEGTDTWTFSAGQWRQETPTAAPSSRNTSAMAEHPASGTLVLFGGFYRFGEGGGELGDTWTWDGQDWTRLDPPTSPSPRYSAAMATDPETGDVVLFGGYGPDGGYLADTWTWDGRTWTERTPAVSPSPRLDAALASHAATGTVVLFGGNNILSGGSLGDTWTWDGAAWTRRLAVPAPSPRSGATFEPDRTGGLLLYGGNINLVAESDDSWTWNGTAWSLRDASAAPGPRTDAVAAFDPGTESMVLFGGRRSDGIGNEYLDDTWNWDGAAWSVAEGTQLPQERAEMGFVYDAARQEVVLFGGWTGQESIGDTWTWDGQVWTLEAPSVDPPDRSLGSMAYDAARQEVVLFGGFQNGSRLGDTWTWDGTGWRLETPAISPPPRYGQVMVYDPAREEVVLFGGSGPGPDLNDTWTWDGTTWTQERPETAPPASYRAAAAYSPLSQAVVLFGGVEEETVVTDRTWLWDGETWTELAVADGPGPRFSPNLGLDAGTGHVILHGGAGDAGEDFGDTWSFDGTGWAPLQPAAAPSGRDSAGTADVAGRLVLFAGVNVTEGFRSDLWTWHPAG